MKKKIHAICRECFKIYWNFAEIETKKPLENLKLFTCPKCLENHLKKKNLKYQMVMLPK